MTAQEMAKVLGSTGMIAMPNGLAVKVTVTDVKSAYGSVRYLVQPVAGFGQAWVNEASLRLV